MLAGPKLLARVSYALFTVAVLLALWKLDGISGAKPLFLRIVPATPIAKAVEPAAAEEASKGEVLDLADGDRPARDPVGRLLTTTVANLPRSEDHTRTEKPSRDDAPVFYRPSSVKKRDSDGGQVCGNLGDFPKSSRVVFPLTGDYFNSYEDTWGAARPQGGHEGTDLMSPTGAPEFAITDGTIVPVKGANENGWNTLGGYTVMLEAAYDAGPIKRGDLFYYAHMDEKSALPIGTKVRAGQQIGVVGDTGEGREATRGKFPPHLHLGWYDTNSGGSRTNSKSGAMNPYPLLLWLEQNGGTVTGGTDAAYCEAPQGPVPDSSGTSPDLDTGDDNDARPSPIVGERQDGYDHSSDHKPGQENGSSEAGRTDNTDEGSNEGSNGGSENDETGDGSDEPSRQDRNEITPGVDQATRPYVGEDSLQGRVKTLLRESSSPDLASQPSYYIPVLMEALRKAEKKDASDGRATGKPNKKKHKKQKKHLEPSRDRELKEGRLATKTGAKPAQVKPVPDKRDATKTPDSRKDLETPPETTGPELQKSQVRKKQ